MADTRTPRLALIAKRLDRTVINSALPWEAVYDNANTDGQISGRYRLWNLEGLPTNEINLDEIPF